MIIWCELQVSKKDMIDKQNQKHTILEGLCLVSAWNVVFVGYEFIGELILYTGDNGENCGKVVEAHCCMM